MCKLKYKVGDKVRIKSLDWYNENKDEYGFVDFSTSVFVPGMSQFCGKIVTIEDVFEEEDDVVYCMEGIDYDWTNEMIECKVEEECPQDFIEKYCKSCGTQRCDRTKEFLDGCPYYNEYMCKKQSNAMEEETKPKMVNLDDVCEWIENHIFDFPWYDNEQSDFSSKDVANALRKVMEE